MLTGRMVDRVSIVKRSTTADGQGGRSTTWVDLVTDSATSFKTYAANVMPARTSERLQAAAIGATLSYIVTLRYRADVTPAMRLKWRPYQSATTKTLEIHGVTQTDGKRTHLALSCAEVV